MKTISIIVAIYNVGDYLNRCLDSIYSQVDNTMEVVLVNDGSNDESMKICEAYVEKYPETLIINQENGGLSDARNKGMRAATGRYLFFVDGDDWLELDAIKTLYVFAVENRCEVVQGGFYYTFPKYLQYDNRYGAPDENPTVLDNQQAMAELVKQQRIKNFVWGKLYAADMIKDIPFQLGYFRQDAFWQHQVMAKVNRYGIIPKPLYYYRQRQDSASGQFSIRSLDLLKGHEERLQFLKEHYPDLVHPMAALLWKQAFLFNESARHSNSESLQKAYGAFLQHLYDDYGKVLDQALCHDMTYQIVKRVSALGRVCLFSKRIHDHFFAPRPMTIPFN